MKRLLAFCILSICVISCAQQKRPLLGETEFQREMNADFKDATKSPLKDSDRKTFKGLEFFKVDSAFVVKAQLKRTPDEKPFKMKTTTERLPDYVKYGELTFQLNGKTFLLDIYQNLDLIKEADYEDYLFLPFLDETNGLESYGGGRYIDMRIPQGDLITIDFNQSYNPYCAYNDKYSCPIVPRKNYLQTRIEAGVKTFKKY